MPQRRSVRILPKPHSCILPSVGGRLLALAQRPEEGKHCVRALVEWLARFSEGVLLVPLARPRILIIPDECHQCRAIRSEPLRKFGGVTNQNLDKVADDLGNQPLDLDSTVERERFLSADEIRQVWRALDDSERFGIRPDTATALRLILATAAQPGMVRGMVGSELRDLSGPSEHGPHWSLPAARMKAGSAFITPLSPLALELIRPHLKTDPDAQLFDMPRHYLYHAAKLIVVQLGMNRWTPHDLRRTTATILDRSGYSLEQIGAILAHTRKGVTSIYARWDKFELRREMATVIEQSLRETLSKTPGGRPEAAQLAA